MSTWIEIIPWVLALPPALWELLNVWKSYGWILGACAGSMVFGGIFLWISVLRLSAETFVDLDYGAIGAVQVLGLLLGPLQGRSSSPKERVWLPESLPALSSGAVYSTSRSPWELAFTASKLEWNGCFDVGEESGALD